MIQEVKTVVVLDNEIINVGEWDYQEGQNSLPNGATVEEREMFFTDEYGWREVGWALPMTLEQENKLLKLQNQANAERLEFMEDLIAEIAMKVYE
ncbi:hypothetical protein A0U40_00645 [[Bacillus] sp. KCTC 13219]|uniref:hypothetical protein n=1 Tax=Metasolibacillus fluoroglycofenilyticus TaxID=1239396 RepID=UPI000799DFD2|nr:hypothetical protein [Metasolibacillus fluoroglycofenilyticus]KYG91490.1 hypothetical protein A0U40_00645 [[Bacillus] sp. KCTC 13219]